MVAGNGPNTSIHHSRMFTGVGPNKWGQKRREVNLIFRGNVKQLAAINGGNIKFEKSGAYK